MTNSLSRLLAAIALIAGLCPTCRPAASAGPNALSTLVSDRGTTAGPNSRSYPVVALDERFTKGNFRQGTTYKSLMTSRGLWAAPGVWWSDQPYTPGYGFDLYPRLDVAPSDIYTVGADGLRLRSRRFTDAEFAKVPADKRRVKGQRPLIGAHLTTFYSLRIRPPFYVEIEATMPAPTSGRVPWPALWLYTAARRPGNDQGREAEVDIHEGFGPDGRNVLRFGMFDWPAPPAKKTQIGPIETRVDLVGRHRFGVEFRPSGVRRTLDGLTIDFTPWPKGMVWDQPWYVLLDNSAGLPWYWPDANGKMQKFLYPASDAPPSDLLVHRVTWRTETEGQVWRNGL